MALLETQYSVESREARRVLAVKLKPESSVPSDCARAVTGISIKTPKDRAIKGPEPFGTDTLFASRDEATEVRFEPGLREKPPGGDSQP